MNKAKRNEAITLLKGLNSNYQEQVNGSDDKDFKNSLIVKIAENEKYLKILENSDYDFSNVKKLSDLLKVKKKPNHWD